MAVAKKDQERKATSGYMASRRASTARNGLCSDNWAEHAEAWLQGFDVLSLGAEPKPMGQQLEAELD